MKSTLKTKANKQDTNHKQSLSTDNNSLTIQSKIPFILATIGFLLLTLLMFGDVLFTSKDIILSEKGTDLYSQFIDWRTFGFNELRKGNLALWNPYIFSGVPFFGGFQSALLYPLNFFYLLLPISKAVNWSIAFHIFLAGIFMYLWTRNRKLHPLACFLSSIMFMFCGTHFMHIYPGHLPNLCTMIWVPLLLLSIDGFIMNRSLGWYFLGTFALTMQILAGHPQYVFYTLVATFIYSVLNMIKSEKRIKVALGIIAMIISAVAIVSVQLLTGLQSVKESARSGGLTWQMATMFSFPLENLITLLSPKFFGNIKNVPYWGRWYLWEMSLFVSTTGFILAIFGSIYGKRTIRCFSISMVLILLLLALGYYTPLFKILFYWTPGFNKFRGISKFIFQASLFIIMLAGIGLDYLITNKKINLKIFITLLIVCVVICVVALFIRYSAFNNPQGFWHKITISLFNTQESYLPYETYIDPEFIRESGLLASQSLLFSSGTLGLLTLLIFLNRYSNKLSYLIVVLALAELFIFARSVRATFDLNERRIPKLEKLLENYPKDYRILLNYYPNSTMSLGISNIWGHDPGMLQRYAQFIAFTQEQNPDEASPYITFTHFNPLYKMLRCHYLFLIEDNKLTLLENQDVMPRLKLIQKWLLIPERDQIFSMMLNPIFDPNQMVILESTPEHQPIETENKGTVNILESSTDHYIIEANLPSTAILLITDPYSKGWYAKSLINSVQKKYNIMPANYTLMAIPLAKGHHLIKVEYAPLEFRIGKWISIVSVIIYIVLLMWYFVKTYKRRFHSPTTIDTK